MFRVSSIGFQARPYLNLVQLPTLTTDDIMFLLCQIDADFDETRCEWYQGKALQRHIADVEYLHHKLC